MQIVVDKLFSWGVFRSWSWGVASWFAALSVPLRSAYLHQRPPVAVCVCVCVGGGGVNTVKFSSKEISGHKQILISLQKIKKWDAHLCEVLSVLHFHVRQLLFARSLRLKVVNYLDLVIVHLEPEPAHAHWGGRGSQLAGGCTNRVVVGRRLQDLWVVRVDKMTKKVEIVLSVVHATQVWPNRSFEVSCDGV